MSRKNTNLASLEASRRYRAKHAEELKIYWRARYYANPKYKAAARIRAAKMRAEETPEQYAKRKERYWPSEKARRQLKYRSDPAYRMARILRQRLREALKAKGVRKCDKTLKLIGCNVPVLIKHIELQWAEGMSWSNFGNGHGRWNIDHIKPCTAFRLEDETEQRTCFHFSNLRPAWWIDNLKKNSNWNGRYWSHADHACQSAQSAHSPA